MLLIVGVNIYHHNQYTLWVKNTDDTDECHPIVFAESECLIGQIRISRRRGNPCAPAPMVS